MPEIEEVNEMQPYGPSVESIHSREAVAAADSEGDLNSKMAFQDLNDMNSFELDRLRDLLGVTVETKPALSGTSSSYIWSRLRNLLPNRYRSRREIEQSQQNRRATLMQRGTPDFNQRERQWARTDMKLVYTHPEGTPQLSAFMNLQEFLIFRKFGWLRTRILMDRQLEIAEMEENVRFLDKHDAKYNGDALRSRCAEEKRVDGQSRRDLLQRVEKKLEAYGESQF